MVAIPSGENATRTLKVCMFTTKLLSITLTVGLICIKYYFAAIATLLLLQPVTLRCTSKLQHLYITDVSTRPGSYYS